MPLIGDLTRPENSAELAQRRRLLRILTERGGCWACIHRDREVECFGRSICSANPSRSFPLCTADREAPAFELDEQQLEKAR